MSQTNNYDIVFRVDSGLNIGSGHLMRCLTLAKSFNRSNITFIYCNHQGTPEHLIPFNKYVIKSDIENKTLLGNDWRTDLLETIGVLKQFNNVILIIDHYEIDYKWEKEIKNSVILLLVVIDDLYERKHYCDILINQNSNKNLYKNLVPPHCKLLLGYKYLILNSLFKNNKRIRKNIKRVNIFMGGSDKHNVTEDILKILQKEKQKIQYDVIIGPSNNRFEHLKNKYPFATFYHDITPKEMASLFYKSDLCIGAAGTSIYERMASGVFTITFCIANNQENCSTNLHNLGVIEYIGNIGYTTVDKLMKIFILKYKDIIQVKDWENIYLKCIEVVDCDGCGRITEEISNYLRKILKTNII